MKEKGWSVAELLARSKLKCDRSSLNRKLNGRQKLFTTECERLASALGVTIAWTSDSRARAS